MSVCKSCGAPIEWCWTKNGNRIPLDVDTVVSGNLIVTDVDRVAYVPKGAGDRVSHFATCPNANQHRR